MTLLSQACLPKVKFKKPLGAILAATAGSILVALGLHYFLTRDPVPIKIDPRLYEDYAGYYDFGREYILHIYPENGRLLNFAPERLPAELLAETENRFFIKGEPSRFTFHRDQNGTVDSLTVAGKNFELQAKRQIQAPPLTSFTNGIVAASTGGSATQAGLKILQEGGTAMDAALATALCEVTHAGGSYVSFAGIILLLYYDAASAQVYFLDAQFQVPAKENDPRSIPRTGGRTALVPGFMAGVQAAHDRFGKLPFARLFEPAIDLAEKGQVVSPMMEWWIHSKKSVLGRHLETRKIFTKTNGQFYVQGDLFRQPALAATLKQVATHGASYIYEGAWGNKFVEVIQRNGGKITRDDMVRYRAKWEQPLTTNYRGDQAFTAGLSAWGGVHNIEVLNLLELADLKKHGSYTRSPTTLLWLMQIAECHKMTWHQHDLHGRDLSLRSRATKETSAWIWNQMQNRTWPWLPKSLRKGRGLGNHSDAIVVADQWGNMAVIGHTINTSLWGNTGLFVDGISIPDPGANQQSEIKRAGSGQRLPNGMNPLIILRNGKPILGCSAIGGGLHHKTVQVLLNILDFDQDPQQAVDTPAFLPNGVGRGTFDPEVLAGVQALGFKVNVLPDKELQPGYWVGVQVNPTNGCFRGAVSRTLEAEAVGY